MTVDNNDTNTKTGERLEGIIDQLSAAGVNPLDFKMLLNKTKRRAWVLDNVLSDILNDEDDAGSAGTLQLVEDVVMGIERLSEAFDAERARKQEDGS